MTETDTGVTMLATPVLDRGPHTYTLDDRTIPGFTHILNTLNLGFQGIASPDALQRGTDVHSAIALVDRGIISREQLTEHPHRGYIESDLLWRQDQPPHRMLMVESPGAHPSMWFATTLDRLIEYTDDGLLLLADLKTGAAEPWHPLQTAAHRWTLEIAPGRSLLRASIYLHSDGRVATTRYHRDPADAARWASIVGLYHWRTGGR